MEIWLYVIPESEEEKEFLKPLDEILRSHACKGKLVHIGEDGYVFLRNSGALTCTRLKKLEDGFFILALGSSGSGRR